VKKVRLCKELRFKKMDEMDVIDKMDGGKGEIPL